ncbi:MAG: NAD-dependent epimerase/dehydratase family protein [Opitutales bacterium]
MAWTLVTGAAGLVGAETVAQLLREGRQVVGFDSLNDYYDTRLKRYRLAHLKALACGVATGSEPAEAVKPEDLTPEEAAGFTAGNVVFRQGTLEDKGSLEQLFAEFPFEAVVNLAARAGVRYSMENPGVYFSTNVQGFLHVLDLMRTYAVPKLVLASTSSLYAGQPMPFTEDLPVNQPISPYAASKKAAEVLAYTYHHLYQIDVSIVRYFTVYGPAGRPDMSPFRFIRWIAEGEPIVLFGDGTQARDFTYVTDIAAGTLAAMRPTGYEIFNLGGGNQPVTINEIIGWIEAELGRKAVIDRRPFHSADMQTTWADISKAGRLLGWQPSIQPREGFRRCIEWYRANWDWARELSL